MSEETAALKRLWSVPDILNIEWSDGTSSEFASLWLRDNLSEDRDPHSGQRLIDIADLPENPRIRTAVARNGTVNIEWEDEPRPASFELKWLQAQASNRSRGQAEFTARRWLEGSALDAARDFAWTNFSELRDNRALRAQWITRLLQDGIAFLNQVPSVDAGILEAASLIGRVSETNYGLVYDVRSVPQPENLAYSDLGLGLHTDNPYREPVPGFQVLHALVASPDGGDSLFGDGFAIAEQLRISAPDAFDVLTRTAVPFRYRSKDAELYAERPLIQLTCSGEISAVHYNSRSIAPLQFGARQAAPFYAAYRRFAALLRDPRFHLQLHLGDGDLVVFDNQRTLHGRTAFSSARHPRHLRGCYLTRDSVYSEASLLRREVYQESRS
jgi:gamma-butyrobetaine dioxygenase